MQEDGIALYILTNTLLFAKLKNMNYNILI